LSEFLLEIGTEELPANFANDAQIQIKEIGEKWLKDNNLIFIGLKSFSTPRRLVLVVDGLDKKQPDIQKEVKGPAVSAAYDSEGKPTRALEGFCKSQNLNLEQLEKKEFKGNQFVYATVNQEGKNTADLLPALIQNLFGSLSVTRGMRWGNYDTKFSRPIHWILALFDSTVVPFTLDDLETGNTTRGHRFLSSGPLEVDSAESYFKALNENKVIVDNQVRKESIRKQLEELAANENSSVLITEDLLKEVNQLVEYPVTVMGGFAEKYLEIPEIVNVTVMKSHQRYFPLFDKNNRLKPNFITISNMDLNRENIREGNEKVLRARLEDAIFFYREDLKKSLENKLEELKRVTYFEEIGSIYDKVLRIGEIAAYLSEKYFSEYSLSQSDVSRAAILCKSDLVTNLVKEFTELQGEIGYYYALKASEKEDVAYAIKEQYLPTGINENLPSRPLGQIINFADKLDNLVSCFALGKIPTGSKDPFSLRRQCLGIIKTCDRYKIQLNFDDILEKSWDILVTQKKINSDKKETLDKIKEFFSQRLKNDLLERGFRYDLVEAVLLSDAPLADLFATQEKLRILSDWIKQENAQEIVIALARIIRICKEKTDLHIDENLFEKEEERILFSVFKEIRGGLDSFVKNNNFKEYLDSFGSLVKPVNNFFDQVMVMVEDSSVRINRLALLGNLKTYSGAIANMDKIIFSESLS
jgi:glycyl-tRNA synthetase beta chain